MKLRSQAFELKLCTTLFSLLALTFYSGTAIADEATSGFCDCSIAEDASSQVICHIPPGNSSNMHTIKVGDPAIHAHLNHGDMLGPCPGDDSYDDDSESSTRVTVTYPTCTCEDGSSGHWFHAPLVDPNKAERQRSVQGQ